MAVLTENTAHTVAAAVSSLPSSLAPWSLHLAPSDNHQQKDCHLQLNGYSQSMAVAVLAGVGGEGWAHAHVPSS